MDVPLKKIGGKYPIRYAFKGKGKDGKYRKPRTYEEMDKYLDMNKSTHL